MIARKYNLSTKRRKDILNQLPDEFTITDIVNVLSNRRALTSVPLSTARKYAACFISSGLSELKEGGGRSTRIYRKLNSKQNDGGAQ